MRCCSTPPRCKWQWAMGNLPYIVALLGMVGLLHYIASLHGVMGSGAP